MSDNTLRVLFTGLCAFVPRYNILERPSKNQMRVLLAESIEPSDLPERHMNHPHEEHSPVFICPLNRVAPKNPGFDFRQPDLVYYRETSPMAVFYLDDQDLRIKDAKCEYLKVRLKDDAGSGCPTNDNKDSFEWVANLRRISPGSERVEEACLRCEDVDPAVVARVELTEGEVYTAQLALDSDKYVILWKYKTPYTYNRGSKHRQAAADLVGFETKFTSTIDLVTKRFRRSRNQRVEAIFGDDSQAEQVIRITQGNPSERIDTWVKNMPWDDILGVRKPQGYEAEPDVHFSHLYKLSSKYEHVNVPHFYRQCSLRISYEHQGNPNCQPARTAPSGSA